MTSKVLGTSLQPLHAQMLSCRSLTSLLLHACDVTDSNHPLHVIASDSVELIAQHSLRQVLAAASSSPSSLDSTLPCSLFLASAVASRAGQSAPHNLLLYVRPSYFLRIFCEGQHIFISQDLVYCCSGLVAQVTTTASSRLRFRIGADRLLFRRQWQLQLLHRFSFASYISYQCLFIFHSPATACRRSNFRTQFELLCAVSLSPRTPPSWAAHCSPSSGGSSRCCICLLVDVGYACCSHGDNSCFL